ncbi:MAG: hypothetical protein SGPRY_013111 [Prymnesium sp.]
MGFNAKMSPNDQSLHVEQPDATLPALQVGDLMRYGFLPEFIGRFPVLAKLRALSETDMIHVMTKPRNALLKQYCALFAADGIELAFTNGAVSAVARRAKESNTGARGLRSIVEEVLVTQATVEEAKPAELNPPPRELDEKARRA